MYGTRINYPKEGTTRRKGPYRKNTSSTTVKIKKEFCPFCHMLVAPADSERRIFLVHNKEVPFKFMAFRNYCHKVGWEIPNIPKRDPFNVEPWIILKARAVADLPIEDIGKQWSAITEFASDIGLRTNFIQVIQS